MRQRRGCVGTAQTFFRTTQEQRRDFEELCRNNATHADELPSLTAPVWGVHQSTQKGWRTSTLGTNTGTNADKNTPQNAFAGWAWPPGGPGRSLGSLPEVWPEHSSRPSAPGKRRALVLIGLHEPIRGRIGGAVASHQRRHPLRTLPRADVSSRPPLALMLCAEASTRPPLALTEASNPRHCLQTPWDRLLQAKGATAAAALRPHALSGSRAPNRPQRVGHRSGLQTWDASRPHPSPFLQRHKPQTRIRSASLYGPIGRGVWQRSF